MSSLPDGVPLRRIGTVGGDSLLGFPLEELRRAWETVP
jgi:hypothetical protein